MTEATQTANLELSAAEMDAMRSHAGEAASLLNVLANESRLLVLCSLSAGEATLDELLDRINLKRAIVFQQLTVLVRVGLASACERAGTKYYSVTPSKALKIIEALKGLFCDNLNQPDRAAHSELRQGYSI